MLFSVLKNISLNGKIDIIDSNGKIHNFGEFTNSLSKNLYVKVRFTSKSIHRKLFINPRKFSGSWNFGPSANEVKNVKEVAKIIISHIEKGRKTRIIFKKGSFEEANLLKLNSEKANKFLNWKTKWTMNQALKKTAVWYNFFLKKKNTKELTDKQIENYF